MLNRSDSFLLAPSGPLDVDTVVDLHQAWWDVIDTLRPHRLVVDLSEVTSVDNIALALFVVTATRQRHNHGTLRLVNAPDHARRLITSTRLHALIDALAA